eukprot:scpid65041/ scgid26404/ Solute carrier family 22 member 15-like
MSDSEYPALPLEPACNGQELISTVNNLTSLTRLTRCVVANTLGVWIVAGIQFGLNGEVFLARPAEHWTCTAVIDNVTETLTDSNCSIWNEHMCQDVVHTLHNERTVAAKYNLLCDQEKQLKLAEILFSMGLLVGGLAAGVLADVFGRRVSLLTGLTSLIVSGIWTVLSPNYYSFAASRFLAGAASHVLLLASIVLSIELVPIRMRAIVTPATNGAFVVGLCLLALVGYLMRSNWVRMDILTWCLAIPFLIMTWILPESPQWLYSQRRNAKLAATVEKIMHWPFRGSTHSSATDTFQLVERQAFGGVHEDCEVTHEPKAAKKETWKIVRLVRSDLRYHILSLFFIWLTASSIYFGLLFTKNGLSSDLYVNFFLISLAELPSGITSMFLNRKFNRKPVLLACETVTLLALVIVAVIFWKFPDDTTEQTVKLVFAMLLKYIVTVVMVSLFLVCPEVFPTDVRALAVAIITTAGSGGAFMTPFLERIGVTQPGLIYTIQSGMMLVSIALTTRIPETKDRTLTGDGAV